MLRSIEFPLQFIPRAGAPLTNFNGEGGGGGKLSDRGSYFIPKKITTSEFVYPKKSQLFLEYPKIPSVLFLQPKKIPLFFFPTPQKSRRLSQTQKITFGRNFRPQKNHSDPPSLKYVSGAPLGVFGTDILGVISYRC